MREWQKIVLQIQSTGRSPSQSYSSNSAVNVRQRTERVTGDEDNASKSSVLKT